MPPLRVCADSSAGVSSIRSNIHSLKRKPEAGVTKKDTLASIGLLVAAVEIEGHDTNDDDDKDAGTNNS